MIKDGQARTLRRLLSQGDSLALAARKTGMDAKSARKYRDSDGLPSQNKPPRTWRTRVDPFAEVWPEVQARLEAEPQLRAFTLFGWLQDRHKGQFCDSQRRTFERRVRQWRGTQGPGQKVMFPQVHEPGDLAASDFTHMNSLGVTIAGQPFEHMLYHFTLTYSNWESAMVCFSESFEAFSRGLQEAFWQLGGVPRKHRSDSLSAAVNNLSDDREFRKRYRDLLDYYRVDPRRINVRQPHENGDIESSHGHLKTIVDQALLLRGSRDFASQEEYEDFLMRLLDQRNASRADKFAEEQACLGELPASKLDHRHRLRGIKVSRFSTLQVKRNTYSVPSRLIGHRVDVVVDIDFVEVWYAGTQVQRMPRLVGSGKHAINYRDVIDSLVRKPGAFEHYQYREEMFPTSHFRMAYDALCREHDSQAAARQYLKILQLAARESQDAVQDALRHALAENKPICFESVRLAVEQHQQVPAVTDVNVEPPDLKEFDSLLQHVDKEVDTYECESNQDRQSCEATDDDNPPRPDALEGTQRAEVQRGTDRAISGTSVADVPRTFRASGGACDSGIVESHGISVGVDGTGMPGSSGEPDRASAATVSAPVVEDVEQLRLDASSAPSSSADGKLARWVVPGSSRELARIWQAGFWEESLLMRIGRTARSTRPLDLVHDLQSAGAGTLDGQAGLAVGQDDQEAVAFRGADDRRPGLCAAKPRGDGGTVYPSRGTVRTGQRDADEQLAFQQVGADLQGRDDHCGRHRSTSASQRHSGTERVQLSAREGQELGWAYRPAHRGGCNEVNEENQTGILIVAKGEK
jgi:hypothetical protein